jgi:hypothetical protein
VRETSATSVVPLICPWRAIRTASLVDTTSTLDEVRAHRDRVVADSIVCSGGDRWRRGARMWISGMGATLGAAAASITPAAAERPTLRTSATDALRPIRQGVRVWR